MHIRRAASQDVSLLAEIIRDAFSDVAVRFGLNADNCPKHPSNCTDEWVSRDMQRDVTYFVLEHEGMPAGCVAVERASEDMYYLERLAVLPDFRKKGSGRALVERVFETVRAKGGQKISIGIISDDMDLKNWYCRLGFVEGETKSFPHLPFQVTFLTYHF